MSVNEVLEAVRTMSPEERAKVRALLESLHTETKSPVTLARQTLCEAGLLTEMRPHATNPRTRNSPVPINGKPLSETVIEDRG